MADKYGIPEGGDPYPGKVKYYKGKQSHLSIPQLHAAVKAGGWPDTLRNTAVAIAIAESGGRPYIYNTYKRGHFGLFQISRSAWPDLFALGSDQWTNPAENARYAYKIYKRQGFGAWEAYTNGRYKANLPAAESGRDDSLSNAILGGAAGILGDWTDIGSVDETAAAAGEFVGGGLGMLDLAAAGWEAITNPSFWMRIAYGAAGVVLLAGGLFLVVRTTAVKSVTGTVQAAVKGKP